MVGKLRWQNLIHKKCPRDNERMLAERNGFKCPLPDCDFFVTRKKMVEILTDPEHSAVKYANVHEKQIINDALEEMGVDTTQFWQQ